MKTLSFSERQIAFIFKQAEDCTVSLTRTRPNTLQLGL